MTIVLLIVFSVFLLFIVDFFLFLFHEDGLCENGHRNGNNSGGNNNGGNRGGEDGSFFF